MGSIFFASSACGSSTGAAGAAAGTRCDAVIFTVLDEGAGEPAQAVRTSGMRAKRTMSSTFVSSNSKSAIATLDYDLSRETATDEAAQQGVAADGGSRPLLGRAFAVQRQYRYRNQPCMRRR